MYPCFRPCCCAHNCCLAELHILDGHPQSVFVESKYKVEVKIGMHSSCLVSSLCFVGVFMDNPADSSRMY